MPELPSSPGIATHTVRVNPVTDTATQLAVTPAVLTTATGIAQSTVAATIAKKRKLAAQSFAQCLYMFAGIKRRSSIGSILQAAGWQVTEIDILQGGPAHDVTRVEVQARLMQEVATHKFRLLLCSPPCDTFSRVKWANRWGPQPTRSFEHQRGFPWLKPADKHRANLANSLVDFMYDLITVHLQWAPSMLAVEFPEDLGAITAGEHKGKRPSSIFQWQQFGQILELPGVSTVGIRQSDFGEDYAKPTRLILKFPILVLRLFFAGLPQFDDEGWYLGPIPRTKAKKTLAKTSKFETFRTSGTAAWPIELCKDLAASAVQSLQVQGTNSLNDDLEVGEIESNTVEGDKLGPYPIEEPPQGFWMGGVGPPRTTFGLGRESPFFDGCGLTSPGRWAKKCRRFPEGKRWDDLRTSIAGVLHKDLDDVGILRQVAALACGKDIFCWRWVEEIRKILHAWLARQSGAYPAKADPAVAEGQPFFLGLIHHLLAEMVDPDYTLFKKLETGVTLGVLEPLPHNPALYELQSSWRLKEDPLLSAALEHTNYKSIEPHIALVKKQFEEEAELGWMQELSNEEFARRYGKDSAISALAVLEEKDKLRVLHDGSNITRVNYRIRCRDRQRMPTVREKHCLLNELRARKEVALSILGDATKAHRRIKVLPSEWGFLGCRLEADTVWINKVQTFGIASASYWWGRAAGGIIRCMYGLLGGEHSLDLLLFADDVEFIASEKKERFSVLLAIVILLALGMPFKWAKFRGGFEVDWVGFHISYKTYSIGLSAIRAQWVSDWTTKLVAEGKVLVTEMCSGLGRLNYAAQALFYERAFLGLLYLWTSTVVRSGQSWATIPWAVRLILQWMGQRITMPESDISGRLQEAPDFSGPRVEWFRSDAKAEGGKAWIGGWEVPPSGDTMQAKWYSLQILESDAPWVFLKKDPQRVIAALELLGTLVSIILFDPDFRMGGPSHCVLSGKTDNRGNSFIVRKLASTKWPITTLLVELSEQLRKRRAILDLSWIPRDDNQFADQLTNEDFSAFQEHLRIPVRLRDIQWLVLPQLMEASGKLYQDVVQQREQAKTLPKPTYRKMPPAKRLKWTNPW